MVQPTFQVLCAIAVGICSGSAGSARAVRAASLSGCANRYFGVSSGGSDTISISGIGASSRHRPIGESSTSLENSRGKVPPGRPRPCRRTTGRAPPGARARACRSLVDEQQLPERPHLPDRLRIAGRGAGMLRAYTVRPWASWSRRGGQARPGSGWKNSSGGPSPATLTCSLSRCPRPRPSRRARRAGHAALRPRPRTARRAATRDFPSPRSSQIGRSRGSTSAANSEMFFSVSSRGIEPFCSITSRLPIRNSRTNASIWLATVAGLRRSRPGCPRSRHTSPSSSATASRPGPCGAACPRWRRARRNPAPPWRGAGSRPGPTGSAPQGALRIPSPPAPPRTSACPGTRRRWCRAARPQDLTAELGGPRARHLDQRRLADTRPALEQQHPAAAVQQLPDRGHLALALALASHQASVPLRRGLINQGHRTGRVGGPPHRPSGSPG